MFPFRAAGDHICGYLSARNAVCEVILSIFTPAPGIGTYGQCQKLQKSHIPPNTRKYLPSLFI